MNSRKPSTKRLLDALVDAVQDLDNYYGRTGREDGRFRELEAAYKAARRAVRQRMNGDSR
jgi:selenocysteine lyase/cysteine desulfurase